MKKKITFVLFSTTTLLSINTPVFAGWFKDIPLLPNQKRHIYKISDVQSIDVETFCKDKIGNMISFGVGKPYKGAERSGDSISCKFQDTTSGKAGISLENGVQVSHERVIQDNYKNYTVTELCEFKHYGVGAFAGDGGNACYDSYRTFDD